MNDIAKFAQALVKGRELEEQETRQDLLNRIENLCSQWRHHVSGFDADQGSRIDRAEGFEKALSLLSECYEELSD